MASALLTYTAILLPNPRLCHTCASLKNNFASPYASPRSRQGANDKNAHHGFRANISWHAFPGRGGASLCRAPGANTRCAAQRMNGGGGGAADSAQAFQGKRRVAKAGQLFARWRATCQREHRRRSQGSCTRERRRGAVDYAHVRTRRRAAPAGSRATCGRQGARAAF